MSSPNIASRVRATVDLSLQGRQVGSLVVTHSDNRQPLGHYPVPVIVMAGGKGPTVLLIGGVHGDEFEGPAALMHMAQSLSLDEINGRIIILPALNLPAISASSRVSPLDGVNMNRAFPGDANGGPTAMLAHYIEEVLLPQCNAAIDLHAGGKASVFVPSALATRVSDQSLYEKNMGLARAFGAPVIWQLGGYNDNRSVNAAAARKGIPMIAAELGGGGGCTPQDRDLAEQGVRRCLAFLGITGGMIETHPPPRVVSVASADDNLYAPARGIFDRRFKAGDEAVAGQPAGWMHFIEEPERPSVALTFPGSGLVLAHGNRGMVERGELLALIAGDVDTDDGGGA
ncbi:MAG: succinylglutamate desuccinylase/aspartoacylase family protein [Alphaproteobacteria bacterium]|nr:succinylglutamate desuccinylase/aspartoacylase family protein [Alphaproteobacteria bacterium]